jgi:hypothetical protein
MEYYLVIKINDWTLFIWNNLNRTRDHYASKIIQEQKYLYLMIPLICVVFKKLILQKLKIEWPFSVAGEEYKWRRDDEMLIRVY